MLYYGDVYIVLHYLLPTDKCPICKCFYSLDISFVLAKLLHVDVILYHTGTVFSKNFYPRQKDLDWVEFNAPPDTV